MDYWNNFSDLYADCEEVEIQKIEAATKARKLGRFALARNELVGLNYSWPNPPVLLLEKANLEASCGLEGNRAKLLADALNAGTQSARTTSENFLRLLSLNHAEAILKIRGSLKSTLATARKQKAYLESIPLELWNSVDIGCAVSYYSIIYQANTVSGWVDIEEDLSLRGVHGSLSLEKLREYLTSVGHLPQAFLLLKLELGFIDEEQGIAQYRVFLERCQRGLPSSQPAILFHITARLYLANLLLDTCELDLSQQELENIAILLGSYSWILDSDLPYRTLRNYQAQLSVLQSFRNIPALFAAALDSREQEDYMLEQLALVCIKLGLRKVGKLERDEEWYLYLAQYQKLRLAHYLRMDGNALAADACTDLTKYFMLLEGADYATATEFLISIKSFEDKYPDFDIPLYRRVLYTAAEEIAAQFGSSLQAASFEIKKIAAQAEERVEEDDIWSQYRFKDVRDWPEGLFVVILKWIKLSLIKNELSSIEAKNILGVQIVEGEQDVCIDDIIAQFSKYVPCMLAREFFGYPDPVASDIWEKRFLRYRDWLWDQPACIHRSIRHTVIADISRARTSLLEPYLQPRSNNVPRQLKAGASITEMEDLLLEVEQIRIRDFSFSFELRKSLDHGALGASKHALFTAEWTLRNRQVTLAAFYKAYRLRLITDDMLQEHQDWFEGAYERYPLVSTQRLPTLFVITRILKRRYIVFGSVAPDAVLQVLERVENDYIRERQAKSVLVGCGDILARSKIWEVRNSPDHYDQAIGSCFEALGVGHLTVAFRKRAQLDTDSDFKKLPSLLSIDTLLAEAVKWAQRKKARSVTEVLGAEIVIPQKLMAIIDEYPDAQELLREEEKLQASIEAGIDNPESIHKDLQDLRQRMCNHEGLSQIMSMRNGEAITYQELLSLSKSLGPSVVITDFMHVESSHTGRDGEIWLMVFHNGSLIGMDFIDASLNTAVLERWRETFMDEDTPFSKAEASANINFLFPLVSCTMKNSKPGDTILFSVTANLTGIPLHAIEVDGEPLIARNKVVYTQSLSIFRLCLFSAQLPNLEPADMVAVQALADAESARSDSPSMQFANCLGAKLVKGPELNKASFLQAISNSSLIHFYGHVKFDRKEPLQSSLEIRDQAEESVTVRDLFDVRLRSGAHVSLIGCQSGQTWKGTNDDSLGLTTAFFHGGASSVISAQWKIKKRDGHEFQEAFYFELLKQNSQDFHDLADALQKAVLQLRVGLDGKVRSPYHWAGFILQGCWNRFPTLSRDPGSSG